MKETLEVLAAWHRVPKGEQAILATVVATSGSTYRRPGARMLITREGWQAGSISGGCLESDLVLSAWERTEHGPAVITYDTTREDDVLWGFGLGCNGTVQVLVERLPEDGGPLRFLEDLVASAEPGVLATVIRDGPMLGHRWTILDKTAAAHPALFSDVDHLLKHGGCEVRNYGEMLVLLESVQPAPHLFIFGAGHDVPPVVSLARHMGWRVSVVDARESALQPEKLPLADERIVKQPHQSAELPLDNRSIAIVMTHNYLADRTLLRDLLRSPVQFVGLLGPVRRTHRILEDLRDDGHNFSSDELSRLHAPVGVDIGAEGPYQIALAIVAQVQAFVNGRMGGFLSEHPGPLHGPTTPAVDMDVREGVACANLA